MASTPDGHEEAATSAATQVESPDVDAHAWRTTAIVVAGFAVLATLWVVVLGQVAWIAFNGGSYDSGYWSAAGDMQTAIQGGRLMLFGSWFSPYAGNPSHVAMPLNGLLHVPVAAISITFEMLPVAFPTARVVPDRPLVDVNFLSPAGSQIVATYSVYAVLWSIPFAKVVRTLAWELGIRRRLWVPQVASLALGYLPMVLIFGHLEDAVMLTLVLFAVVQCNRRNWTNAAICLMFALSLKQTAALVAPLFFFFVPREERVRFTLIAVSLPLVLVFGALVTNFDDASQALFNSRTAPTVDIGRQAWFLATNERRIDSGGFRALVLVAAVVVALWLRRNRSIALLTAGIGTAFLVRLPFEAVTFLYYASPALVVALIYEQRRNGRPVFAMAFGTLALTLYWWKGSRAGWFWPAQATLLAAATWPMWLDVIRRSFGADGVADHDGSDAEDEARPLSTAWEAPTEDPPTPPRTLGGSHV